MSTVSFHFLEVTCLFVVAVGRAYVLKNSHVAAAVVVQLILLFYTVDILIMTREELLL